MSYHVSILRSQSGKQVLISLPETIAAASSLGGWIYADSPPTFEFKSSQGSCVVWYQDGELWAKSPQQWELEPMLSLAKALAARVRGDEFETYRSINETYFHPDDEEPRQRAESDSREFLARSTRTQKRIRNGIVGIFVILAAIGFLAGKWFERQ